MRSSATQPTDISNDKPMPGKKKKQKPLNPTKAERLLSKSDLGQLTKKESKKLEAHIDQKTKAETLAKTLTARNAIFDKLNAILIASDKNPNAKMKITALKNADGSVSIDVGDLFYGYSSQSELRLSRMVNALKECNIQDEKEKNLIDSLEAMAVFFKEHPHREFEFCALKLSIFIPKLFDETADKKAVQEEAKRIINDTAALIQPVQAKYQAECDAATQAVNSIFIKVVTAFCTAIGALLGLAIGLATSPFVTAATAGAGTIPSIIACTIGGAVGCGGAAYARLKGRSFFAPTESRDAKELGRLGSNINASIEDVLDIKKPTA
jgi:hypothetical protein